MYESDGTQDGSGSDDGSGNGGSGNGGTGTGTVDGSLNSGNSGSGSSSASTYTLTVTDGIGSGTYAAGTTITITAGTGASGTAFSHWSSSNTGVIFADPTKSSTTITMPASDATVIANFAGQYTLEVEYGSGSGSYMAGTKVAISAIDPPAGKKFSKWTTTTSGLTIESSTKESTTITMPSANAKVTANYVNTTSGSVSGNSTSTKRNSQNGTTVSITKSGISDTDKASAYVTGSSDNFVVKISESLEAADEVQKALMAEYGDDLSRIKYFAMDISLYDATGQTKITNTDGLTVNITMPIPDALKEYAGNNRVASVVDGALDKLNPKFTTIDGVASVTFTATHFSPYTVYVDTANLTATGTLDSTPKTGDGIHPKWFLSLGLACISMILFLKKDKSYKPRLS
jgi:hypothetical protein